MAFNFPIFLICLGAFCLATFLPYGIGRWRKAKNYEKYLARNWFAVVFPAMLALYLVLVDGMDVLQASVTKAVVWWGFIQGVLPPPPRGRGGEGGGGGGAGPPGGGGRKKKMESGKLKAGSKQ